MLARLYRDSIGFVLTDEYAQQSVASPKVFALGDAASLPVSKAGSVTDFQGEVLVQNLRHFLNEEPLYASFDGYVNCFIETGFSRAMRINFNYDVKLQPRHYRESVGLPQSKESRLNHLGKLMFLWFYWHSLLPGRDIPGIHRATPLAGKPLARQKKSEEVTS